MINRQRICEYMAPAAVLLAFLFVPFVAAAELTAAQSRGKQIYLEGTSPSGGEITAVVGTEVPCVLTSRADSEESKFLSIAMGCRLVRD